MLFRLTLAFTSLRDRFHLSEENRPIVVIMAAGIFVGVLMNGDRTISRFLIWFMESILFVESWPYFGWNPGDPLGPPSAY